MSSQRTDHPSKRDAGAVAAPHRRYSLTRDVLRGAVWGDFALDKKLPGTLTQIILGYVPVLGTLGALRDAFADWRTRDPLGVALNLLAVFPVAGGIPKTIEVLHSAHRLHHTLTHPQPQSAPATHRGDRAIGCVLSLILPVAGLLYGLGVQRVTTALRANDGAITAFTLPGSILPWAPWILLAAGFFLGVVLSVRSHSWLGLFFLPAALVLGFTLLAAVA